MNTIQNETPSAPSALMTEGDALAELDRSGTLPKVTVTTPETFKTEGKLLPPKRRAIAVSGSTLNTNMHVVKAPHHQPLFEVFELMAQEDGSYTMLDAKMVGLFRHVEVLGVSWLHHSPNDPLAGSPRRVGVVVTDAPLRVYEDTAEFAKVVSAEKDADAKAVEESRSAGRYIPRGC